MTTEKPFKEEEINGLDQEIDAAVDRLFVEKGGQKIGTPFKEGVGLDQGIPTISEPASSPILKAMERMESLVLSLEWDINRENLEKLKKEVYSLRELFKKNPKIISVLNFMEETIKHMIKNEENIRPSFTKFLIDSKETIKLLYDKKLEGKVNIYQELLYTGIEARFYCLEGVSMSEWKEPSSGIVKESKEEEPHLPHFIDEKKMDEILKNMDFLSQKMNEVLKKIDQHLLYHSQPVREVVEKPMEAKPPMIGMTIFKVGGRLFGIESERILKIFKIPIGYYEKYSSQQRLRLKDFELRIIDLRKIFLIKGEERKEEKQILTLKDGEEYKGFIVDQIVNKIAANIDSTSGQSDYFMGIVHWSVQDRIIDIPVIDSKRF